jgi:parallel beta-helix repeat protein
LPTSNPGTASGNLIEGYQVGIYLFDGAANNVIQGNAIRSNGIGGAGTSGQELGGVLLASATNNQVGTAAPGSANDIARNQGSGVVIFMNATGNSLASNRIHDNTSTGVYILGAPGNHVGLNGAGNTISDNGLSGVDIEGAASTSNTVLGNTIQRSGQDGVYVFNAAQNAIGGANAGDGNTIQNNGFSGVHLEGSGATQNVVQGNTISNQSAGYGILLDNGATQNTIGGDGGAANALSNNALGNIQVLVGGLPPSGDPTGGNTIGTNTTGNLGSALKAARAKHHYRKPVHHKHPHAKHHNHPAGPRAFLHRKGHAHG